MYSRLPATLEELPKTWKEHRDLCDAEDIATKVALYVLNSEPASLNPDAVEFVPRREPLPPQYHPQQQHQQLVQLLQHLLQQRQQQQLLLLQQLLLQQKQQRQQQQQ